MNSFELTIKAKADLKNIAQYSDRKWGKSKRNNYIKQLDDCFHLLAEKPNLGFKIDFIHKGYMKFPQNSHMIFFKQITNSRIQIIRILHHKMDVKIHI